MSSRTYISSFIYLQNNIAEIDYDKIEYETFTKEEEILKRANERCVAYDADEAYILLCRMSEKKLRKITILKNCFELLKPCKKLE